MYLRVTTAVKPEGRENFLLHLKDFTCETPAVSLCLPAAPQAEAVRCAGTEHSQTVVCSTAEHTLGARSAVPLRFMVVGSGASIWYRNCT